MDYACRLTPFVCLRLPDETNVCCESLLGVQGWRVGIGWLRQCPLWCVGPSSPSGQWLSSVAAHLCHVDCVAGAMCSIAGVCQSALLAATGDARQRRGHGQLKPSQRAHTGVANLRNGSKALIAARADTHTHTYTHAQLSSRPPNFAFQPPVVGMKRSVAAEYCPKKDLEPPRRIIKSQSVVLGQLA